MALDGLFRLGLFLSPTLQTQMLQNTGKKGSRNKWTLRASMAWSKLCAMHAVYSLMRLTTNCMLTMHAYRTMSSFLFIYLCKTQPSYGVCPNQHLPQKEARCPSCLLYMLHGGPIWVQWEIPAPLVRVRPHGQDWLRPETMQILARGSQHARTSGFTHHT